MLLNFSENFYGLILLMKSESQTKEEKYCFLLFLLFEKQECFFTYQFIPYTLRIFLWIWNFQKCLNYRNHRFRRNLWLENSPRGQTFSINPEGRIFQSLVTEEPMNRNHIYYPLITILEEFSIISAKYSWNEIFYPIFENLRNCSSIQNNSMQMKDACHLPLIKKSEILRS